MRYDMQCRTPESANMRQAEPKYASAAVLNSWKEIAIYLGRGVRTVQRWERDLDLPIHRPRGKQRSAVLAIPAELDYWIQNTPGRGGGEFLFLHNHHDDSPPTPAHLTRLRAESLRTETRDLRARSHTLLKKLLESTAKQCEQTTRLRDSIRTMNGGSGETSIAGRAGSRDDSGYMRRL